MRAFPSTPRLPVLPLLPQPFRWWASPIEPVIIRIIHHDGWQGPNPRQFTTDPGIHGRFETSFVEPIQLTAADLSPLMGKLRPFDGPFAAILAYLDDASTHVGEVYILDKTGALADSSRGPRPSCGI